jgi:hypothetical protein
MYCRSRPQYRSDLGWILGVAFLGTLTDSKFDDEKPNRFYIALSNWKDSGDVRINVSDPKVLNCREPGRPWRCGADRSVARCSIKAFKPAGWYGKRPPRSPGSHGDAPLTAQIQSFLDNVAAASTSRARRPGRGCRVNGASGSGIYGRGQRLGRRGCGERRSRQDAQRPTWRQILDHRNETS